LEKEATCNRGRPPCRNWKRSFPPHVGNITWTEAASFARELDRYGQRIRVLTSSVSATRRPPGYA
jgi:hypothetical protein